MGLSEILLGLSGGSAILLGLLGGLFIWLLNDVGALPVLFLRGLSRRVEVFSIGLASGIMFAASFTSLILPGLEIGGIGPVATGIAVGAFAIVLSDELIPHKHFEHVESIWVRRKLKAVWLFALAITIHNMPEGLSVGIGLGSGDLGKAIPLMVGIGLQNIPEGAAVSFSFYATGQYSRVRSFLFGIISGSVEVVLALIGALLVSEISGIVPWAMGFAAGAMIFVISDEMIPETHSQGKERVATYGLMSGFLIMLILDWVLG